MMKIVGKRIKKEKKGSKRSSSVILVVFQMEELTKGVMEKMEQLYGPLRAMDQRQMD